MSVDLNKGATVELVKTLSDDIRTETEGGTPKAGVSAGDVVRKKASPDGNYPNMTAGTANAVLSENYTEENEPYLFRKSGGSAEIGTREEDKIVGGTIAWNQLIREMSSDYWDGMNNTVTYSNGVASFTPTAQYQYANEKAAYKPIMIAGHKYFVTCEVKAGNQTVAVGVGNPGTFVASGVSVQKTTSSTDFERFETIKPWSGTSGEQQGTIVMAMSASGWSEISAKNFQCFDLTQMFGSAVADAIYEKEQASAGAGVAWFKALFPKPYYSYDAGTLMHVGGLKSHDTVGKNLAEFVDGKGINTNGEINDIVERAATVNPIRIQEGLSYKFTADNDLACIYAVWKGDTLVRRVAGVPSGTVLDTSGGDSLYVCAYKSYYVATVEKDKPMVCYTTANNVYEPYRKNSYALDSSLTLRGVPKLVDGKLQFDGDTYSAEGKVTRRYGIVDLGTLTWNSDNSGTYGRYWTTGLSGVIAKAEGSLNFISSVFVAISRLDYIYNAASGLAFLSGAGNLSVTKNGYATEQEFTTAMSGVYLVYELATPTTETAQSYTNPQIVSKYGTEEYVCETEADVLCPVGHVTKYYEDVAGKVAGLPSDFSTLIAPTETGMTATRAYTVNQFLIVNNQLYKVIANIANGGTITVGTNVTAVTIADILTALLNA